MAFTEQNKADAYLFFVLAFNAAPGTVYGGQIVEAYESGMTTADIVAQYVEKPAFTSLYPTTQTANEFATALVNNVSSGASVAVKASAVADIETALAAGWTKAQVVTQILGNLANKTVADADWGQTVAQLNNKIAVAKALTEGPLALTSEDAAVLQGPLANVTHLQSSVQPAINGAGPASNKIEALAAAKKAQADFWTAGKFIDSTDVATKAGTAVTAVVGTNGVNDAAFSAIANGKETVSAATQAAIIAVAKQKNADALTKAKAELATAKDGVVSATITKAEVDAYLSTKAALAVAKDASDKAGATGPDGAQFKAVAALDATAGANAITATAVDPITGTVKATVKTVTNTDIITVQSGKLALTAGFVAVADAKELTAATKLLESIVAAQAAAANTKAAQDAADAAKTALGTDLATVQAALDAKATALKNAEDKIPALDKALKEYNEAIANLTKDTALTDAITAAEKAFTDAGQTVPKAIGAVGAITTAGEDLFVVDKDSSGKVLAGFAANDKIFAGKGYAVSADITKGDDAKLEVFFKANGASTDVYIEQKAFGSNTTGAADGNADFIKITLTGVAADKLVLKDGFVTVAA